jgi:tryptophanyl-tRNA synthetase
MAALYRRGGFGYGEIKKALADEAERYFAPARQRRQALAADPSRVHAILADGAARARKKAAAVLDRAKRACGLIV